MNKTTIFAIVGILIIGVVSDFLLSQKEPSPTIFDSTEPSGSPSLLTVEPTVTLAPGGTEPATSGTQFQAPEGRYSFKYPSVFTLDTSDAEHIRIYKRGATQRDQSELSDGALIVFEASSLERTSLSEFVDSRIAEATADGVSEVLVAKQSIVLNGNPGFSYSLRGLGSSTVVVVQKDENSPNALVITYLVADPENVGYQEEVTAILNSLQLKQ